MKRRHPRAQRLQVVLDLTEREEKAALASWGELEQKLRQEEQQRQQLTSYHDEYQQKISTPGGGISAGQIHNTLGFMAQIETAMKSQSEQIRLLKKRSDAARETYLKVHGKVKALTDLIERLEQEAAVQEDIKAQKQSDEWANRAAFKRNTNNRN